MGKTKEWYINTFGLDNEREVMLEAELMRQKEEYLYYAEFKNKSHDKRKKS